ncbi:uncharacterized protein LOC108159778 isoform X2 [Drosophila miranda]|uniref:uncharacterized protein LOC108159778 isoform X2 n=1 Tax=Drosophila miranda TaxID=7229 RepID=UPI00143FA129|nr:uncharacterized protein LOC108159778 isoform X2 [Drosophila miranda]
MSHNPEDFGQSENAQNDFPSNGSAEICYASNSTPTLVVADIGTIQEAGNKDNLDAHENCNGNGNEPLYTQIHAEQHFGVQIKPEPQPQPEKQQKKQLAPEHTHPNPHPSDPCELVPTGLGAFEISGNAAPPDLSEDCKTEKPQKPDNIVKLNDDNEQQQEPERPHPIDPIVRVSGTGIEDSQTEGQQKPDNIQPERTLNNNDPQKPATISVDSTAPSIGVIEIADEQDLLLDSNRVSPDYTRRNKVREWLSEEGRQDLEDSEEEAEIELELQLLKYPLTPYYVAEKQQKQQQAPEHTHPNPHPSDPCELVPTGLGAFEISGNAAPPDLSEDCKTEKPQKPDNIVKLNDDNEQQQEPERPHPIDPIVGVSGTGIEDSQTEGQQKPDNIQPERTLNNNDPQKPATISVDSTAPSIGVIEIADEQDLLLDSNRVSPDYTRRNKVREWLSEEERQDLEDSEEEAEIELELQLLKYPLTPYYVAEKQQKQQLAPEHTHPNPHPSDPCELVPTGLGAFEISGNAAPPDLSEDCKTEKPQKPDNIVKLNDDNEQLQEPERPHPIDPIVRVSGTGIEDSQTEGQQKPDNIQPERTLNNNDPQKPATISVDSTAPSIGVIEIADEQDLLLDSNRVSPDYTRRNKVREWLSEEERQDLEDSEEEAEIELELQLLKYPLTPYYVAETGREKRLSTKEHFAAEKGAGVELKRKKQEEEELLPCKKISKYRSWVEGGSKDSFPNLSNPLNKDWPQQNNVSSTSEREEEGYEEHEVLQSHSKEEEFQYISDTETESRSNEYEIQEITESDEERVQAGFSPPLSLAGDSETNKEDATSSLSKEEYPSANIDALIPVGGDEKKATQLWDPEKYPSAGTNAEQEAPVYLTLEPAKELQSQEIATEEEQIRSELPHETGSSSTCETIYEDLDTKGAYYIIHTLKKPAEDLHLQEIDVEQNLHSYQSTAREEEAFKQILESYQSTAGEQVVQQSIPTEAQQQSHPPIEQQLPEAESVLNLRTEAALSLLLPKEALAGPADLVESPQPGPYPAIEALVESPQPDPHPAIDAVEEDTKGTQTDFDEGIFEVPDPLQEQEQKRHIVEDLYVALYHIGTTINRIPKTPTADNLIDIAISKDRVFELWKRLLVELEHELSPDELPPLIALHEDIAFAKKLESDSMGLEFLNKLRKIFSWTHAKDETATEVAGTGAGIDTTQNLRSEERRVAAGTVDGTDTPAPHFYNTSRKRSYSAEEQESSFFKYRRVDSTFPRYITNPIAEDMPTTTESMADQKPGPVSRLQTPSSGNKRLSIFNEPRSAQHIIRYQGLSSTHIDLSDDDESPVNGSIFQSFGRGRTTASSTDWLLNGQSSSQGNGAAHPSSIVRRSYADAVRLGQGGSGFIEHVQSGMNGHQHHPHAVRGSHNDSLLIHEERRSEREQYNNLLHNVAYNELRSNQFSRANPPPLLPIMNWSSMPKKNTEEYRSLLEIAKQTAKTQRPRSQAPAPAPPPPPPMLRTTVCEVNSSDSNSGSGSPPPAQTTEAAAQPVIIDLDDSSSEQKQSAKSETENQKRIQAMQKRFSESIFFRDDFEQTFRQREQRQRAEADHKRQLACIAAEKVTEVRRSLEGSFRWTILKCHMGCVPLLMDFGAKEEDEKEIEFIPLVDEQLQKLQRIVTGPDDAPVISKYGLTITKKDIRTLTGLFWLNDEVINFYMNLLTERSQQKKGILPSVYGMNTFFLPRLIKVGFDGVKRWTRKIDVLSNDIIPVPVHCNGMHWCMAIIHLKNKTIFYYDSLGKPNHIALDALKNYIMAESLDKRKEPYDMSGFRIENVLNGPQQTNGSDCGVFSCMTAEYITRGKPLTFNQEHMSYFRKKMILEIVHGQLWK